MARHLPLVVLLVTAGARLALAAPQTTLQQRCLNDVDTRGSLVWKAQGKVIDTCLRDVAAGHADRLGVPPQPQTAQACPENDRQEKAAKSLDALADVDAARCLAIPAQRPDFAYTGAAVVGPAALVAARGLAGDVFGPDLDVALVTATEDVLGTRCQQEVMKRTTAVATAMWKLALAHRKAVLAGKNRRTGSGPVADAGELAAELVAAVTADDQGTVAKAAAKLASGAAARCAAAATPLAALFPGACAASAGAPDELAACATSRAKARFWESLATFDALDIACDLRDDGVLDGSCTDPKNVVLILADDLGWADVGFHASGDPLTTIPTPSIDRLAGTGIVLDQFFVQPVCSPTRAEVLTGRSATRVGVAPTTLNPRAGQHMRESEVTLAEAFAAAGWDTAAFGKWHLGTDLVGGPLAQGFGHFTGILNAAADYFTRRDDDGTLLWQVDGTYVDVPGYTTDLITAEAVSYLESRTGEPFFLYVPYTAPHNPQQAPAEYMARVPAGFDPARTTFAAMVIGLDDGIGAILDALERTGLDDDTVVVFASDNGGSQQANNAPLRGGKGNTYDGGVRVPAVVRVPGHGGGTVVGGMIAAADLYPTLLALAGAPLPDGLELDGADVSAGLLAAATTLRPENAWVQETYDAYRTPQWKLFRRPDGMRELYDVAGDPFETTNLAAAEPAVVTTLVAALDAWNARVGAKPSHVPLPAGTAAPSGDVIHAVVDVAPGATGALVQIRLSRDFDFQIHPGDWLEYDVRFEPGSRTQGFVLDLDRTNRVTPWDGNPSVRDQANLDVGAGEAFPAAVGTWRRRTIGLGNFGTQSCDQAKLMFLDLSPGHYDVSIDNLVVHRFDGTEIVIYRDGPVPDPLIVLDGTSGVTASVTAKPM
jgi:arylsulfatase A-like enzyme